MLTPTALLILFLSSLFLRFGIKNRNNPQKVKIPAASQLHTFDDDHIPLEDAKTDPPKTRESTPVLVRSVPLEPKNPSSMTEKEEITPKKILGGITTETEYRPSPTSPETSIEERQFQLFFDRLNEVTSKQKIKKDSTYIYITGIKHSGKTTKGRLAAQKLGLPFKDLDELMLELCEFSPLSDLSIREIYNTVGKDNFMLLEYATMHQYIYLNQQEEDNASTQIIALGGGICDNLTLLELLSWTGSMIYIETGEDVLYSRIIKNGIPPFLDSANPKESFHEIFISRDACYRGSASIKVKSLTDSTIEDGVERLLEAIEQLLRSST